MTAAIQTCRACAHPLRTGALFCTECGSKVEIGVVTDPGGFGCFSCGAPHEPGGRFCRSCGAAQGSSVGPSGQPVEHLPSAAPVQPRSPASDVYRPGQRRPTRRRWWVSALIFAGFALLSAAAFVGAYLLVSHFAT